MHEGENMKLEWTNQLNEEQKFAAKELIKRVLSHDGTFREPYLSNQFNPIF